MAPIHLASLFAGALATQPAAAIVNISSGLAFAPLANKAVYCATKAAIHSFCLSLRRQLRDTTVKVFEIIPPSLDTELGHQFWRGKQTSHGGMALAPFLDETLQAIEQDLYEAPITDHSRALRENREALFDLMNP